MGLSRTDGEHKMTNRNTFKALSMGAFLISSLSVAGCVETSEVAQSASECPSDIRGNECEYYLDGYRAGASDGSMGMSMAYERHEGYDLRFEPYFARGYEAVWMRTR